MFNQYFWIDYLCIDQDAHGEKSQQVQRMHIIYRNAELVIIWLQLSEKEESGLLEFIDLVDRWLTGKMNLISFLQLRQDRYDFWYIAGNVMENPYWKRVWIVQEVVVAKEVCVYTKRTSLNLDKLHFILRQFHSTTASGRPTIGALCHMRATGGKIPLWRMLKDFKDYECKYAVDRIYGIFGLAENNEDGSSPAMNIQIDYEKPVSRVMLDVLFESSPPLNHLGDIVLADPTRGRNPLAQGFVGCLMMRNYINDVKTTERHRDCARNALKALEAFVIMWSVMGTPRPDDRELLVNLFSSAAETDWKTTRHQNAVLLGMMLSAKSWNDTVYGHSERPHFRDFFRDSAWRCAAHGFRDACQPSLRLYETVAVVATSPGAWSRPGIVAACGKQSKDCDGSMMTYELSDIGLRIQVEPAIDSGNEGYLSIHSMQSEA
ncbi:hypothetical protein J7T55_005618 [Diaporthe amygdali]|uniref:uncharacterized protein n=1 Tax=Phomopsis amygdali TaxID=1214568 RepID=UPI0022FED683|nr:uncharacterized protein J7T55_005618 [Diaporthe amygdali]KAJ0124280.1 hypothetical protein J7T55_005618 [Diaporthe amygdali]